MEKYSIANWKMNLPTGEPEKYVHEMEKSITEDTRVILAVPTTHIAHLAEHASENIIIAAQNIHEETSGAYTGEVSAELVKDAGAKAVIIGHSERRTHLHETNTLIARKMALAIKYQLLPILCVGENAEQRENGHMLKIIREQLRTAFSLITKKTGRIIIAYEPVWAIGTGHAASLHDIEEMHVFMRRTLVEMLGQKKTQNIAIVYGGSITPKIAAELAGSPNIDGFLVGKASLDPRSFKAITHTLR